QKTAYEIFTGLEFRRVLFRSQLVVGPVEALQRVPAEIVDGQGDVGQGFGQHLVLAFESAYDLSEFVIAEPGDVDVSGDLHCLGHSSPLLLRTSQSNDKTPLRPVCTERCLRGDLVPGL